MTSKLETKLKDLPKNPGVYFHKNTKGDIIYIGKAAILRNRVRQYFQASRNRDPKTEALVAEIADVDWIEVETELDALFIEAELIRRYLPPYNILLRDDKSLTYIRISYASDHPTVSLTRRPLDDGAQYFGPYFSALTVRRALKYLRRIFPYSTHISTIPKRACLQYHLGLCPGLEAGKTSLADYRHNLKKLIQYLRGERQKVVREVEKEMKRAAKAHEFEAAATARNQLFALKGLGKQIVFSDREILDISKDQGLTGLAEILNLFEASSENKKGKAKRDLQRLRRIEGFDISHMQGTDNTASMVVFVSGVPDKAAYRKFKLRLPGNNDFAHMEEAISRRLSEKNRQDWGTPDLFLIDGGKGQLAAALKARNNAGLAIPMIGLAKREEEIVISNKEMVLNEAAIHRLGGFITTSQDFSSVSLPLSSHIVKLLQRIRDESHRFAVSYHSVLKRQRQVSSLLDEIPTIGPASRKKLLKTFGSMRGLLQARDFEVEKVVGEKRAAILLQYLRAHKRSQKQTTISRQTDQPRS